MTIHADFLRRKEVRTSTSALQSFAMYVVPADILLKMTTVRDHEALMQEGILVEFEQEKGRVMFVSHQWAGLDHPDPTLEQFRVLQNTIEKAVSGKTAIYGDISIELYTGQQSSISGNELASTALFIWYDYFSCPQSKHKTADRSNAISSIPAYVERCYYFVILCPHIRHKDHEVLLGKESWQSRGWCRLERAARELSLKAQTGVSIEVRSANRQALAPTWDWINAPVGDGQFTQESDREQIAPVLHRMVQKKLDFNLVEGEFHNYRLLLNMQRVHFRGLPIPPIEDVIPGFDSALADPAEFTVERFMYQNGFQSVHDRCPEGWSPICYAALDGNPLLLAGLLERRADVNDGITNIEPLFHFAKGTRILHICAFLRNNEAVRLLIEQRASLEAKDGWEASPMHWACLAGNVEAIRTLDAAGSLLSERNMLGYTPFVLACQSLSVAALRELLPHSSQEDRDLALFSVLLHERATPEIVCELIKGGADVNHQLNLASFSPLGLLMMVLSLRHRWKQSTLSTYAYHSQGATPLMCSVITSGYEATAVLLATGARTDLRNGRGRTAASLALEMAVPGYILDALEGRGDARAKLVQAFLDDKLLSDEAVAAEKELVTRRF